MWYNIHPHMKGERTEAGAIHGCARATRSHFVLSAAAGLLLCGCASLPMLESDDPAEEIRRFYVDGLGAPECSVAVVSGGRTKFAGDEHALYRIGSLTKLFVAAAADRLAARGALDLDVPVVRASRYALAPEYGGVSLRDLMEHRSGMPRDFLNPWNPLDWHVALMSGLAGSHLYAAFDGKQGFEAECNASRTLAFLRDRVPRYSNVGFALFAATLEDATCLSVEELLQNEVVRPQGLEDTTFAPDALQSARLTKPCAGKLPWLVRKGAAVPTHQLGTALVGMGGLYSSVSDCAKFLSRPGNLKPGRMRERTLPSGRKASYRFGMIYGGASFVCRDEGGDALLVILRNVTSWPASEDYELADRLFARLAGRLQKSCISPDSRTAAAWSDSPSCVAAGSGPVHAVE